MKMNTIDIDNIIGRLKGLHTDLQSLVERAKHPGLCDFGQADRQLGFLKKSVIDLLDLHGLKNWTHEMELEEALVTPCGMLTEIVDRASPYVLLLGLLIEALARVAALPHLQAFVKRLEAERDAEECIPDLVAFLREFKFYDTDFTSEAEMIESNAKDHKFCQKRLAELIEEIETFAQIHRSPIMTAAEQASNPLHQKSQAKRARLARQHGKRGGRKTMDNRDQIDDAVEDAHDRLKNNPAMGLKRACEFACEAKRLIIKWPALQVHYKKRYRRRVKN